MGIRFLVLFLIPLHSEVVLHMCAPIFLAHIKRFLRARRSRKPGSCSRLTTSFLSHFHLLLKVSHVNIHWVIVNHTFSSHTRSSSSHFLAGHKPLLSQCSTVWARNLMWVPNSWIKVDCCLSYGSFWTISQALFHLIMFQWIPCTLLNAIVWAFLARKSFAVGSFVLMMSHQSGISRLRHLKCSLQDSSGT